MAAPLPSSAKITSLSILGASLQLVGSLEANRVLHPDSAGKDLQRKIHFTKHDEVKTKCVRKNVSYTLRTT